MAEAMALERTRVEALQADLQPTADYAEGPRGAAADAVEQLLAQADDGSLRDCQARLEALRERILAATPAALQPRGLFDSRGRRLKRFRAHAQGLFREADEALSDLTMRLEQIDGRRDLIDRLWAGARSAAEELEAHARAARAWLRDRPVPAEDAADEHAGFRGRAQALAAAASGVVSQLPLARAAQNADEVARDRLTAASEAIAAWRAGWTAMLGLGGRKPAKVRPDPSALDRAREVVCEALARAEAAVAAAQRRRSEVSVRMTAAAAPVRGDRARGV
jgi:hypothetical protein